MNTPLQNAARKLLLTGLLSSLETRLQEAQSHQLTHAQFLELLLQDEIHVRQQRQIERRLKAAQFRERRLLEDFDWSFNPSIARTLVYELATARFVREHRDLLLLGPPGVGKSHLAQALGYCAIKAGFLVLYVSIFDLVRTLQADTTAVEAQRTLGRWLKPDLLIIDDFGIKTLPPKAGECLLEIVLRRHETRSTVMTSNRPIEEWGKLLHDVPAATAIIDRFLHRAEVIQITGRSFRLKDAALRRSQASGSTPPPESAPTPNTNSGPRAGRRG